MKSRFELWLDERNHIMEFMRTIGTWLTVTLQLAIIAKLWGWY